MDESIQTRENKLRKTTMEIHTIDQTIVELEKKTAQEKIAYQVAEQQKKDLLNRLNRIQMERESLNASFRNMSQSKEFCMIFDKNESKMHNSILFLFYSKQSSRRGTCSIYSDSARNSQTGTSSC